MAIITEKLTFSITGADGSAASPTVANGAANVSAHPVSGQLLAIYVDYGTQPSTTDVVVKTKGDNAPAQTFLTLTNANTSGWFYPRVALHDTSGVAATLDGTRAYRDEFPIDDYLAVTVAQGNAGSISVYVVLEK